jgi:FKBP-type peptidyl-prolyl cis-trans isomerase
MSRSLTALAAVPLLVLVAACGDSSTEPIVPQVIEEVTFDPALEIDLSQMTKLSSGVYIQTLDEGSGDGAAAGATVDVAYVGFLTTGVVFNAGAFDFVLGGGRVLPGFDEGVTGMKVGERRLVIVPPGQAYGLSPRGNIPGGSILIFDLEVRSIS